MAKKRDRRESTACGSRDRCQTDAPGSAPDGADPERSRILGSVADELDRLRAVVDHTNGGNAPLAEEPDAMGLPLVRSGMVPREETSSACGGAGMVAGVAPDRRSFVGELAKVKNLVRREKALAMISAHVAMSGACCADHASIRSWTSLAMCARGMAGCAPEAEPADVLSRNGWWLRRWWPRVSIA